MQDPWLSIGDGSYSKSCQTRSPLNTLCDQMAMAGRLHVSRVQAAHISTLSFIHQSCPRQMILWLRAFSRAANSFLITLHPTWRITQLKRNSTRAPSKFQIDFTWPNRNHSIYPPSPHPCWIMTISLWSRVPDNNQDDIREILNSRILAW